ncbi:MAG: hypothetical protein BYD32DRAFT_439552 [Podila humilis]|nr:MAG: hypothetical protein BYD32DRAFT_439552 [Podila humilis]
MQRVQQQLTRVTSLRSVVIPAILMRLSGSAAALSGPEIPGTNGLTLGALLSMVPMSAMVGSGIARQRWSQNSARWVDGVSPLLLTYADCQAVLDTTIGEPMLAAHLNQSSIFECQDTVGVSSLIRSATDGNNCYTESGGRSQKLACVDWRVRDGGSTLWRCYTCYSLALVVVGLGWTYGSWLSDLPGLLGFMALVTISMIGSHPRLAKDVEPLTCNLTFARRRSACTLAYIMHGSPEQLGWWHGAFPSTDRQTAWERNVRAWINGETLKIDLEKDDMGDLFPVQNALLALDKAGFKAVHAKAEAGVTLARNADLDFLLQIHSTRTALQCLEKNCFCRKEQGLMELAAKKIGEAEKLSVVVESEP